jgi:hypothetical protein
MSDLAQPPEPAEPLRQWLVAFRNACEILNRAMCRKEEIPTLGKIVKKKSSDAMKKYWRRNKDKSDTAPRPYPQVNTIPEQCKIEKINHDISTAMTEVAIQRSNLILMLAPLSADPKMSGAREIRRRPTDFTNDVLIAVVERIVSSPSRQPTRRRKDSPSTALRNSLIRQGLQAGESPPKICQTLDKHKIPTTPKMQSKDVFQWNIALNHPDLKNNVQQLFSKERRKLSSP